VQVWHPDGTRVAGPIGTFFVYSPVFTAGIYVAAGDVDGDGRADVITGAGREGGPHVRAFRSPDLVELANFFAYDGAFTGGVRIAAGDFNADGRDDIITAPGPGGGPHVRVFSTQPVSEVTGLLAYAAAFTGGLFIAGTPVVTSPPPPAPLPPPAATQAEPLETSGEVPSDSHEPVDDDESYGWLEPSPEADAHSAAMSLEENWLTLGVQL
jgi:hypothetical protein